MNATDTEITIILIKKLSHPQEIAVWKLQQLVFTDITKQEVKLDFYSPEIAHVLAYSGEKLVGWAGIHQSNTIFEGKKLRIGGYGICTHPDFCRQGIASKVSRKALAYLNLIGVKVAFLSVDLNSPASIKFHQKNGFVLLTRNFSWTNSKNEIKHSQGGMIAPVNSQKLFENILNGKDDLYVGQGYW